MKSSDIKIPAFFNENGITSTSANHLANIAKENYMAIEKQMASLEFYRTAVSFKERNRYLELGTKCAVIGKFIHPDGKYSEARKDFFEKTLSPKKIKENGKETLIYSYYPNIDEQEIDSLFFSLQSEHRKAQAELNGMKNDINRTIEEDWTRKCDKWSVEHDKWSNDMLNLKEKFMREKEAKSKEIENLKIAIPNNLKAIYEKIKRL